MATTERTWPAVSPQAFVADGALGGVIAVADTAGFRTKQQVQISNSDLTIAAQVKRVLSPTMLIVGPFDNKLTNWAPIDLSVFTVASGASILAPEQNKSHVPENDRGLAVYEGDPVCAIRTIFVDQYGDFYDPTNPLPISFDGTVQIGDVAIKDPNSGNTLTVNPDGSINVIVESVPSPNSNVINTYNELLNLAAGATSFIVSYTVPVGMQAIFQRASFSGENIARYDLFLNGTIQATARTNYGADYTGEFNFTTGNDSGLIIAAGQNIQIQVYNFRSSSASFEGRIQALIIPV